MGLEEYSLQVSIQALSYCIWNRKPLVSGTRRNIDEPRRHRLCKPVLVQIQSHVEIGETFKF